MSTSAIVVGLATAAVSVGGSYLTARYVAKQQADQIVLTATTHHDFQIKEIDRQAEVQYRYDALLRYRQEVAGPKSQIIETIHDVGDRLYALVRDESGAKKAWTGSDGYYRQSFTWLLLRPLIWMEVLRSRRSELDTLMSEIIAEDQNFQSRCRLYEISLERAGIFTGLAYDEHESSAHIFAGDWRRMAEILLNEKKDAPISWAEFLDNFCGAGPRSSEVKAMTALVSDLAEASPVSNLKLGRLLCVYVACVCMLEGDDQSFRSKDSPEAALARIDGFIDDGELNNVLVRSISDQIIGRSRSDANLKTH